MGEFAKLIDENSRLLPRRPKLPALTADAIVGGVYEAVFRRVAAGEPGRLPELLPDVIELALMPYMGEDKAIAIARKLRTDGSDPIAALAAELADTAVMPTPTAGAGPAPELAEPSRSSVRPPTTSAS